jgi:hypothetical protein
VRVGRSALDEDAIRLLEEYNPDVEFDWTRMLKAPPESAPEPQPSRSPRRQEESRRFGSQPPIQANGDAAPVPAVVATEIVEESEVLVDAAPVNAPTAALARLGPEGLQRLRGRYAELMNRITQRVSDPARQEELKSQAERLNPDNWVTNDEVTLGLDGYEATFEEIRNVVGRPRKRRRRRRGSRPEPVTGHEASHGEETTEEAEPAEHDDDADGPN